MLDTHGEDGEENDVIEVTTTISAGTFRRLTGQRAPPATGALKGPKVATVDLLAAGTAEPKADG